MRSRVSQTPRPPRTATTQTRRLYETDMTDLQWQILGPLLPPPPGGGRPREVDLREVLNAIFYVKRTGCAWKFLPHDFPPAGLTGVGFSCIFVHVGTSLRLLREVGGPWFGIPVIGLRNRAFGQRCLNDRDPLVEHADRPAPSAGL
jgi:transposase